MGVQDVLEPFATLQPRHECGRRSIYVG
eukprot:COSAG02_NODE_56491_length_285_cov_0.833333_1_plen_27_part_10